MEPIIFKQSDSSKTYRLELNNYNKWFIVVDGDKYLTQKGNTKIYYKVNITKTEEPLKQIKQDYELEQKINDTCDKFLNELLNFNIFEVVDDYRKYISNEAYKSSKRPNINDFKFKSNNKYLDLIQYLNQTRNEANDIYRNYTLTNEKMKSHYNIHIEINKISNLYLYEDQDVFKIRDLILNQIMTLPDFGLGSTKLTELYKTNEEFINGLRISEVIDNITFNINNQDYQYEDVTNDKFVYKFQNKYNDLIFIQLGDEILRYDNSAHSLLFSGNYIIYKSNKYSIHDLYVNCKKYLYIEPVNEFNSFKSQYDQIDLNFDQGQEIIKILRVKFKLWSSRRYDYFNDVILSKLLLDIRIETALKILYKKHEKYNRILDYGIWTYDRGTEYRVNIKNGKYM